MLGTVRHGVRRPIKSDPLAGGVEGEKPELCFNDPGREVGLVVTVDDQVFGGVLLGRIDFGDAVEHGNIRLDGAPELVRVFPTWLGVTRFARYAPESRQLTGRVQAAVRARILTWSGGIGGV